MVHYVTPTTQARQARWLEIFGTLHLPVLERTPRVQETRDGSVLAFDLAIEQMHWMSLIRLAERIRKEKGRTFDDVYADVCVNVPLNAEGLIVVEFESDDETAVSTANDVVKRPFPIVMPSWPRVQGVYA